MNWFRKHLKHGSRLALFALAIQLVLSCGHFHGTATAQAAPSVQSGLADVAALAAQTVSFESTQRQQPAGHDDDQHTANACAVCAVLSLANNFLFATPPLLELPRAVDLLHLTTGTEFAHLGPLHPAFHSRAPPVS